MATQKHTISQRDFSVGEIDVSFKRGDDDPLFRKSARTCANFRITDTKKLTNRTGRSVLFIDGTRVDEVLMKPGQLFFLVFGNGVLSVRNAAGTVVFTSTKLGDGSTSIPWTTATVKSIRWDVYQLQIFIAYADGAPANPLQILTWDGSSQTSTWTLTTFTETVSGNQKRTPFYRLSPQGVTMQPSAASGAGITLTFSAGMNLVSFHVGTRMRYIGRQLLITAVASSTSATATVEETLFTSTTLTFGSDPTTVFSVSDVVLGKTSGASGIVISMNGGAKTMVVQLINAQTFAVETIVGPSGNLASTVVASGQAPQAVTVWDDEVMNSFRGFPSSLFVDQGRLGLCNFPALANALAYSAIGTFTDLYVPFTGVTVSSAIFELAPNKSQVLDVVPGMEGSEFIFCDNAVYYFPITLQNPLSGTVGVAFNKLTNDGCAAVQPRMVQEAVVFVSAGGSTLRAITATGAYQRPYEMRFISMFHDHLFNAPVAIAAPSATDPNFPERYLYVLNGDGTLAVGKLRIQDGQLREEPGWVSESGVGSVNWISARGSDVIFTTTYPAPSTTVAEKRDATQFLDQAFFYNNAPAAFLAPFGKGPLFWYPGSTVTVMDLGTRQLGLYSVDANGFLIPQGFGGENLASAQLVVGQAWTATFEPWLPAAEPGADIEQRLTKRQVDKAAVYYVNSTGFVWQRLFSGTLKPAGPAYGTVQQTRRVATYNQDDDATLAPPLREDVDIFVPLGTNYDPRIAIVKDSAGPLTILEFGAAETV